MPIIHPGRTNCGQPEETVSFLPSSNTAEINDNRGMNQPSSSIVTDQQQIFEMHYARLHHLPPIGYKIDLPNVKFIVDESVAPFVRQAFERVAVGERVDDVRNALATDGFMTPIHGNIGGRPVSRKSFYNMLNDPFYTGYICFDGRVCKGFHQPLVTTSVFVKIHSMMVKRRKNWN